MASSLATQLAQNASLNSALLVDRSRRKPTASYLFTGREADDFDLEVVHALAVNGFLQLIRLDSSIQGTETGGSAAEENTRVEEVEDLATGGLARSQKLRIPTASQAGNISRLEQFEDEIFSDAMKGTDRTLLSQERVKELDDVLERFMRELGPWLLEPPCGRVIEYLVRRFRCAASFSCKGQFINLWNCPESTNSISMPSFGYSFPTTNLRTLPKCFQY